MKSRYVIPKGYRQLTITILVGIMILQFFDAIKMTLFQNFLWDFVALIYFVSEWYHEEFDKVKARRYDWWLNRIATGIFSALLVLWLLSYMSGGLQ